MGQSMEAIPAPLRRVSPTPLISPATDWGAVLSRARALVPEAFETDGTPRNLTARRRLQVNLQALTSPIDGRVIGALPMLSEHDGAKAIGSAAAEADEWLGVPLEERRRRVEATLSTLTEQRQLLALLLVWEIGKPYRQALTEVDRALDGARWYLENIEGMLVGRRPLGLIASVASWNYPLSVLFHSVLVQVLAGNASIAKVPTKGGLHVLTVCFAVARRHGLPVSLVSGPGGSLGNVLAEARPVSGVMFVGGRKNGLSLARRLGSSKRTMIEMEGVNAYGIWDFTDWGSFQAQLKKGFEYGKQRCTAYTRFVVQRRSFGEFLDHYGDVVGNVTVGNPLAVREAGEPLPDLDFGPLIDAPSAQALMTKYSDALAGGAATIFAGSLDDANFVPGQDRSAYLAPRALLGVPRGAALHSSEPFGPVDSVVLVDTEEELVAEMNVSRGSLVATISSDDERAAARIAPRLMAFKVGVNELRSRGDRDEPFGGLGDSWSGAFVGGSLLVDAVTDGQATPVGNYAAVAEPPRES
jgi:acyl-CoA reductase-like NAD-dependent aldehyde dehydrogenase